MKNGKLGVTFFVCFSQTILSIKKGQEFFEKGIYETSDVNFVFEKKKLLTLPDFTDKTQKGKEGNC